MKKIKNLILLLSFSITGFTQSNTFIIKVIDAKYQVDSVVMGYRDNATVGIDADLGESDYFEKPYTDLDIRSIQRDSLTNDSLWLIGGEVGGVPPFSKNLDFKRDFRDGSGYLIGEHFVLQIHTDNYPVKIFLSSLEIGMDIPYCTYDNNLANSTAGELHRKHNIGEDTLFVLNSSIDNKLIGFHPQSIVNIKVKTTDDYGFTFYPNPAKYILTIKTESCNKQNVTIFNCKGIEIERFQIQNNQKELSISNYPKGLYFIRSGFIFKKFIKI